MDVNKFLMSLTLVIILLYSIMQPAAAMSDLAGAGLDIVTEIANSQDAAASLKNYSKDKFDDWLWETAGGYEKIISGNLGESQIEQIKGKFDTIQTIINGITDFALAIDAGRYDEALYHTIEASVNTIDHPLVSATWAAAKLTYQSHQMVKDTKAETEIARLFHYLHKDRRLFSAEEGEMKMIPENADTIDYFFNKYIVTDPSGRTMMKAYVEQRLGEEWPEESWGSWLKNLRTIGSGLDTEENAEIEALTGQYKNTARNWIRNLIEDVNLEAQRWYKEKELQKLMTEFEAFRQEFSEFSSDIGGLIRGFAHMKEIQAKEDSYRELLHESEIKYAEVNKNFGSTDKNKRSTLSALYSETVKWENELTSKRSDISWAGMKPLADSYLDAIRNWHELRIKIFENLPPVITDPVVAYDSSSEDKVEELSEIEVILISDLLEEPEFIKNKIRVDELKNAYEKKITDTNSTDHYQEDNDYYTVKNTLIDLNGLNNIIREWSTYYNECNEELRLIANACERREKLYHRLVEGEDISQASEADHKVVNRINSIAEAEVNEIISRYDSKHNKNPGGLYRDDNGELISYPNPRLVKEFKKNVLSRGLVVKARNAVNEAVVSPAALYLRETNRWFSDRQKALGIRIEQRKQQYEQIENAMIKMRGILTGPNYNYVEDLRKEEALKRALSFSIADWLQSDEDHILETISFNYSGVSAKIVDISDYLLEDARNISGEGVINPDYLLERESRLLEVKGQVEAAKKIWDVIELPDNKEEEEIKELVDKDFSVKKLSELGNELNRLVAESQEILPVFAKIRPKVETENDNALSTAEWLRDTAFRMDLLFEDLQSSGLIKDRFVLDFPEGTAYIGENANQRKEYEFDGMILTAEPYPHLIQEGEMSKLHSVTNAIKNKFSSYNVLSFYNTYARNSLKTFNDIMNLKIISDKAHPPIKAASEGIIVHPNLQGSTVENLAQVLNFAVIRESSLEEAEVILKETVEIVEGEVDENYRLIKEEEFIDNIRRISELLPLTAEVRSYPAAKDVPIGGRVTINGNGEKVLQEIKYLINEEAIDYLVDYPLAERYKQFALDLRDVFYKYHHRAEEEYRKESERLIPYDELAYKIEGAIDSVEFFIMEKDYKNAILYKETLEELKDEHRALPGEDPGSRCLELLEKLEILIKEAEELMLGADRETQEILNKIRKFYDKFSRYYQSQDEFAVLSLLAGDWEAGDGTTLWDLEETLIRNFRVFDEISYQITNLHVAENRGSNRYIVNYNLKIVSQIYDKNIKHEEISSVREIVEVNEDGSGRILKTLGGHFWKK